MNKTVFEFRQRRTLRLAKRFDSNCRIETYGDDKYIVCKGLIIKLDKYEKNSSKHLTNEGGKVIVSSHIKNSSNTDGGKGSGFFDHKGVKGQLGGSAPSGSSIIPTKFKVENRTIKVTTGFSVPFGKKGKTFFDIADNSNIEEIVSFAGKGSDSELVMSGTISKQVEEQLKIKTEPKDWSHKAGTAKVKLENGRKQKVDIHWFEHDDVGQIGWRIKSFVED